MADSESQPNCKPEQPRLLSMRAIADELRVSQQWLKYWLVANPVDGEGLPFYVPIGRRWKFEARDVERIITHMRELEAAKLGPSTKSKIRMMGLMKTVGGVDYAELVRMREAKGARLLPDRSIESVGARPRSKQRKVRLPRHPIPDAQ